MIFFFFVWGKQKRATKTNQKMEVVVRERHKWPETIDTPGG